jgi:leucyl aminopeptidase
MDGGSLASLIAQQFLLANYEYDSYKTEGKEEKVTLRDVIVTGKLSQSIKRGFGEGTLIGEEINACRTLENSPAGEMTPKTLGLAAIHAAKGLPIKVAVLGKAEIEKLGMGGVLGVARGSSEEPRFIVMEHMRGKKGEAPVVLVGKGVTFDSGGLNLKPGDYMNEMHMDMSGGAAVIHAIALAGRMGLRKNIVALVPAVENMPSGSSYRPGDILKTMSGKTIEIGNTDAEGRVILSDALTYAERYKPRLVVDVATLTGAAAVALGQRANAILTKDKKLSQIFERLAEETGDYAWPLPLWDEYEEDIKGAFADFTNSGKTRYGGAITAAAFLYQFAKNYPWVHLDIAPRMTSIEGDFLAKGATGTPISLLIRLLGTY